MLKLLEAETVSDLLFTAVPSMSKHTVGVQQVAIEQMTNQNRPNVPVYV